MITMLNQDSLRQAILFEKAWTFLQSKGLLDDKDKAAAESYGKNSFSDLAHYFAYLPELIAHDPLYVMLPVDETPFEIDANSRTITIPKEFSKCGGVQSDNYSEIVTFTVDRYFDYKDLSTASIAVQWINESAQKEGVSFIDLIDLETYGPENKIRFGWPLTAEMTSEEGNLRFAVRFFTAHEAENGSLSFNYLLNTTPASIPIKATLMVDLNKDGVIKNVNDYEIFTSYITRSMHPSYAIPKPVTFVVSPKAVAAIDLETNSLKLEAEAIAADNNSIIYEWYHLTPGFGKYIPYDEEGNEAAWPTIRPLGVYYIKNDKYQPNSDKPEEKEEYITFTGAWPQSKPTEEFTELYILDPVRLIKADEPNYSVTLDYYEYNPKEWPDVRPNEKFFIYDEEQIPAKHVPYSLTAPWPIKIETEEQQEKLNQEAGYVVPTTKNTKLYTLKSVLTFKDTDGDITGKYFVRGINRNEKNTVFTDAPKSFCSVLSPSPIKIIDDLNIAQTLSKDNTLNLSIEKDGGYPLKTYSLYKDGVQVQQLKATPVNEVEFEITEFGTYYIDILSELNRGQEEKTSTYCTVYDNPLKPSCDLKVELLPNDTAESGTEIEDYVEEPVHNAFYVDSKNSSSTFKLTVDVDSWKTNKSNDYNIGDLEFVWTLETETSPERIITAPENWEVGLIASQDVNTNVLKVRTPDVSGLPETPVYTYRCTVVNKLPTNESSEPVTFSFYVI